LLFDNSGFAVSLNPNAPFSKLQRACAATEPSHGY
jgi:hypothetical protein